ncbi:hypothetical protein [Rhodococcus sp. (in: high G+C Gram-positive bacteria)]|uniref:hypothetical protein n=1 Tax=Rhodococcus sp. TaxID=1831 RepID=UPI0025EE308E|nr:hypothetical protein [Rhodococcus sp. (in: high G+C Gram-positive bacteria)]
MYAWRPGVLIRASVAETVSAAVPSVVEEEQQVVSLWSRALSVEELEDRPWSELMPWLDRYGSARTVALSALAPTARWWEVQSPADTAHEAGIPEMCAELARIYVTDHPDLRFADALRREVEVPVSALDLDAAAATVIARLPHAPTTAELFSRSPADLFVVRGSDRETVDEIVCAVLVATVLRDSDSAASAPGTAEMSAGSRTDVPALDLLLEDLAQLARWRMLSGDHESPLLRVELDEGAPEEVRTVAARIRALTALDLPVAPPGDPIAELGDYIEALPEPERQALRRRVRDGVDDPAAPSTFPFGTAVGDLLAALRVRVRPVASFDRILRDFPVLTRPVPALDAPLWKVLHRLDDRFEVADGWVAVPDLPDAEKQTRALLAEFESGNGVVEPAAVQATWTLPPDEFAAWTEYCGTAMFEGRLLAPRDDLPGRAAQVLEVLGDPHTADELVARMGVNADVHTLFAELSDDERFAVADDRWSLVEWDTDVVTAIRNRIARLVDDRHGSAPADVVETALVERFGISGDSARTFAAGGEFEVVDGRVRRRPRAHVPVSKPERTRRLYRLDDGWRLRIPVTRDHVRGAECAVPSAVAAIVGCDPGSEIVLPSRLGGQTLRWAGPAPLLGSIRRFLEDLGVDADGELFLDFRADGHFDVLPLRTVADNAEPLRKALALVGHTTPEVVPEDRMAEAFATALGLGAETRPRRILSAYRARRETDVVALLEEAWIRVRS